MEVIIPIGISGSGKSRLYKTEYNGYFKICPDDIRLELTGDISNQKMNKQVFERVDELVSNCIRDGVSFFLDATNINTKYRKEFVEKFKGIAYVKYIVLPSDINISHERISKDLSEGVVRSKVSKDVLERQYGMYKESLNTGFIGENVQEVSYL